jgi:hypothetical protein
MTRFAQSRLIDCFLPRRLEKSDQNVSSFQAPKLYAFKVAGAPTQPRRAG